jgi:predicted kinase
MDFSAARSLRVRTTFPPSNRRPLDASELVELGKAIEGLHGVEPSVAEVAATCLGELMDEYRAPPFFQRELQRAFVGGMLQAIDVNIEAARGAPAIGTTESQLHTREVLRVEEAQHRAAAEALARIDSGSVAPLFQHLYSERMALESAAAASWQLTQGAPHVAPLASGALSQFDNEAESSLANQLYVEWRRLQGNVDQLRVLDRSGGSPDANEQVEAEAALRAFLQKNSLVEGRAPYGDAGRGPNADPASLGQSHSAALRFDLDDEEIASIASDYLRGRARHVSPSEEPRACLLAGLPGADKVGLASSLAEDMRVEGGSIRIDNDRLRERLPYFAQLVAHDRDHAMERSQRDAMRVANEVLKQAVQSGYNVLVEGTLRDANAAVHLASQLRGRGYRVEVHVVAAPELTSRVGAMLRRETEREAGLPPRVAREDVHRATFVAIEKALERLEQSDATDRLVVHQRYGDVLFDSAAPGAYDSATEALRVGRSAITPEQKATGAEDWDLVVEMMRRRQAPSSELASMTVHRAEAHHQMRTDPEARAEYEAHATPPQRAESRHLAEQHATYLATTHTWPRTPQPAPSDRPEQSTNTGADAPRRAARNR